MAKYFTNIPLQPENLRSLREALIKEVLEDENIRQVVSIKKVRSGEPLAILGEMDAVGHAGAGCNPTFDEIGIGNAVKRWALEPWEIALSICYQNLEDTIAEYCLKEGTEIGNLEGTDFMAIYLDMLVTQMKRMIWRFAWFGDKNAATVANGGVITNGTDLTLMNANDGLFKRLFAIGTADPTKVTAIAANSQASYAAQKAAIRTAGVATALIDTILMDANPMINANGEAVLMMNTGLADALANNVKKTYKDIMPWEKIFDGVFVSSYGGVKVVSVATWDYMVNTYENTGTAWNLPYRVVFANPKNLLVGCDSEEPVSELDIWFNKDERQQKVYATGKLDTMVGLDDHVHLAY